MRKVFANLGYGLAAGTAVVALLGVLGVLDIVRFFSRRSD
jgi:hypothetical protein